MGSREADEMEKELARIESASLGGGPASPEERAANPQVIELKRRQKDYPPESVNALAEFFSSKEGPRMHGRKIRPEWWK